MNPNDAFLAELEWEAATTRGLIDSVPETMYDWRPNERGRSMGELCGHLASLLAAMPDVLGGESFDVSQRPEGEEAPADRAEALANFDDASERAKSWLASLGNGAQQETWRLTRGEEELMALPRAAAIRTFLFNHLYHHRGQLSAYLRAAGEPVRSVYGPTADFDPFAA